MNESFPEIKNCICCWYDLLGYGKPFMKAKWNLFDDRCKKNYIRIARLSSQLTGSGWSGKPLGTKILLNDGFACTIDLEPSKDSFQDALFFLEGIINDFVSINHTDMIEFSGMRGIITCGQRFSHSPVNITDDIDKNRTIAYHPAEFQMNTAFSKAFIMDEAGGDVGLIGPNLFIDKSLINLLREHANILGFQPPEIIKKDTVNIIRIFDQSGWFADLMIDPAGIHYLNYKKDKENGDGIDTFLYKHIGLRSRIDEIAEIAAQHQAKRAEQAEREEYEEYEM